MRAVAVLVLLSGCQLVFRLEDEPPDPQVTLRALDEPVLSGTTTSVELAVVGLDGAVVSYELDADAGTFDATTGNVVLAESVGDGLGRGLDEVLWTPPDGCVRATLGASAGYDLTIDPETRSTFEVPVSKRFGLANLTSSAGPISANQLLAMPITIDTGGCNVVSLGVAATQAMDTTGNVGLYDDNGSGPGNLLVSAPWATPNISEETEVEHAVQAGPLPAGQYWVAIITNGNLSLDAQGSNETGPVRRVDNLATDTLPDPFPPSILFDVELRFRITLGPP